MKLLSIDNSKVSQDNNLVTKMSTLNEDVEFKNSTASYGSKDELKSKIKKANSCSEMSFKSKLLRKFLDLSLARS